MTFVRVLPWLMCLAWATPAAALVADHTSIDNRDPLVLPFPATAVTDDVYLGWQLELHWDTSSLTLPNGERATRSPSDGQNALTLGYKPLDELGLYAMGTFAARTEAFQVHSQLRLHESDDSFPLDVSVGAGLGYSAKGSLLPEGQVVFGRVFRRAPEKPVRSGAKGAKPASRSRVVWAPQFVLGLRMMGQAFSDAQIDGDPNSPYAGVLQRRLVFDVFPCLEAEWKGFSGRLGAGWENLVQTYHTREDTPGTNFNVQNGPFVFFTLGASFSLENI